MNEIYSEELHSKAKKEWDRRDRIGKRKSFVFRVIGVIMALVLIVTVPWLTEYMVKVDSWLMGLLWDVIIVVAGLVILTFVIWSFNLIKDGTWCVIFLVLLTLSCGTTKPAPAPTPVPIPPAAPCNCAPRHTYIFGPEFRVTHVNDSVTLVRLR